MKSQSSRELSQWHALSGEDAAAAVESNLAHGLHPDEAAGRLIRFGPNTLPETEPRSLLAVFARQFKSPLIYLLLVAAGITMALGERTDAVVIFVVVLLNAIIGAFQEGRAERALAALRRIAEHKARVVRGGRESVVQVRDIVPGDILVLDAGSAVSADARLFEVAALKVAEAALTGESVPVSKDSMVLARETVLADRRNMVYSGTHVTAGRARAVVVGSGLRTEIGRIATLAATAVQPKTPLERRIDQFGRYVIVGAVAVFAVIMAVGLRQGIPFTEIFMISVSSLVGMVPEGLPVAMTIALAVGVQRMAKRNAVVRRLSAVETLGSTTVICSDKTGTLTRNEMTVTSIYLPSGQHVTISGVGYAPEGTFQIEGRAIDPGEDADLRNLLEAGVLCNDAQLDGPDADSRWRSLGDPTEIALLTVAAKARIAPSELRARFRRLNELPFDAAHKMMAVQCEATLTGADAPHRSFVVIKGAPEAVLSLCGSVQRGEAVVEFPAEEQRSVRLEAEAMASRALRLLAVAIARDTTLEPGADFAGLQGRATFLGLIGQYDPPRTEVTRAVRECRDAGIRPVVVTGDHKATGFAIARELGIAGDHDIAVDGAELDRMSEHELDERIESIAVFARVHPAQKLRIVEAYQRRREIVAMTGDGVNDAPALVRANVGVAMGISGTEVAKDAATVVITDDNFSTIVAAVEEGRVAYRNIKKAVLLLFSTSAAEVAVLVAAMLFGYPPPFAAVQILWNNLVTEGVITVNLIMEPAEGDEMQQRPISPDEPLLTRLLLVRMAVMVPCIVLSTLGWFVLRSAQGVPAAQVQTETFTLLAVCEWFNVLNCRSERKSAFSSSLFTNRWLLAGLVVGNLLQVAVVFWGPLARIFHTVPLGFQETLALGAVGSLVLWAEEARKLVVRMGARCAVSTDRHLTAIGR